MRRRDAGELERKISRVYAWVDRRVAATGLECEACGKCCLFSEDYVLYACSIEVWYLLRNTRRPEKFAGRGCAYLDGSRCEARRFRPLGCRTYFCDPRCNEELHEVHNRALRTLRKMVESGRLEWRYGPMMEVLKRGAGEIVSNSTSDCRGDLL